MLVRFRERAPIADFGRLERDVDRILNGAFGFDQALPTSGPVAVEVLSDADGVSARAELPGVDPSKITVGVENRVLTIRAEREEARRENGRYQLRERAHGAFAHSFRLAADLDANAVSAEFHDGVLTVRVPRAAEAKPRQIEVKTS